MFIKGNADIQVIMKQNGIGNEMIVPQILHQFYIVEPIGGGGGGTCSGFNRVWYSKLY